MALIDRIIKYERGVFMDIKTSLIGYTREKAVKAAYELGYQYELKAHYCPQASLAALMDVFHMKDDTLFKSVFGFHGGGGDSGFGICGALAGGIVSISYLFGRTRQEFDLTIENKTATPLVKQLVDLFDNEFEGIRCRDCQNKMFGREFDFWKEEEGKEFQRLNGHEKCAVVVGTGASLAAGVIWDALHKMT